MSVKKLSRRETRPDWLNNLLYPEQDTSDYLRIHSKIEMQRQGFMYIGRSDIQDDYAIVATKKRLLIYIL